MPEPTASGRNVSPAADTVGARYGRTARTKKRDRWLLIGLGAFIVVVMACWTVWAGLDQVNGSGISADSGSDQVIDAQHVKVSFTVSADAGASVACAIEAQDVDFTVTGWKIVQLPVSAKTTRSFSTVVRTIQPSVTGSVDSCWSSATR
ncbi:DUF4307 domain-containing protein [Rathayibacter sp. CAU 1779]